MNFPQELRYTKDHEWIKIVQDNIAIVGITEYAQQELGDIVYVEIETTGEQLEAHDVFGTIEAVKTVSDLFLPVAGIVKEVNSDLENEPALANEDPYGEGWLIRLEVKNIEDLNRLMNSDDYESFLNA